MKVRGLEGEAFAPPAGGSVATVDATTLFACGRAWCRRLCAWRTCARICRTARSLSTRRRRSQTTEHDRLVCEEMHPEFARAFATCLKFFTERAAVEFVVARHGCNLGTRIGHAHRLDRAHQALAGVSCNEDEFGIARQRWKAASPRKVQERRT